MKGIEVHLTSLNRTASPSLLCGRLILVVLSAAFLACENPPAASPLTQAPTGTVSVTAPGSYQKQAGRPIGIGFTAFPYDLTQEAVDRTFEIVMSNSTLHAIHLDQCVPWEEALGGRPFPAWLEKDWDDVIRRIPADHKVYVAVTPTAMNRKEIAGQCGSREGNEKRPPREIRGARYDSETMKRAYLNYARRVVQRFNPTYVNIGIEISEMALRQPGTWPEFQALYMYTFDALKAEFPNLQIGVEFVLQSLLLPRVAELVKPAVEKSDYVGISFYPYGTEAGVKFGAPALPAGRNQWNQPLDWLRKYTDKPIAICETGYTSKYRRLRNAKVDLHGDEVVQAEFLKDLFRVAQRDNYLFIIWFIAIDYEKLRNKIPVGEAKDIWINTGLFDSEVRPKPAWKEWLAFLEAQRGALDGVQPFAVRPRETTRVDQGRSGGFKISFETEKDLFHPSAGGRLTLEMQADLRVNAMRWDITYKKDWALCDKEIPAGVLEGIRTVRFSIRSSRKDAVLLRVDEKGGETYYTLVPADSNWREVTYGLDAFTLAEGKKGNGRLDPDLVDRIWFGDGAGEDGAKGSRVVWISPIVFGAAVKSGNPKRGSINRAKAALLTKLSHGSGQPAGNTMLGSCSGVGCPDSDRDYFTITGTPKKR